MKRRAQRMRNTEPGAGAVRRDGKGYGGQGGNYEAGYGRKPMIRKKKKVEVDDLPEGRIFAYRNKSGKTRHNFSEKIRNAKRLRRY